MRFRGGIDYSNHEEVLFRLRQLEDALFAPDWVPREWNLTHTQKALVSALSCGRTVSREHLQDVLYGMRVDGGPDIKHLDVHICNARRRLKGTGIEIMTEWGKGFYLTEQSLAIIN